MRSHQGARELRLAENGLTRYQHQDLIEVGCKGLGAPIVLPEEQIASLLEALDHATVAGGLPAHAVTHHQFTLLAAGMTVHTPALRGLDDHMAAVGGDNQAQVEFGDRSQG